MFTRNQSKANIKMRGWSQRKAAKYLGRNFTHLNLVLNGKRASRDLLGRIAALPQYRPGLELERAS